MKKTHLVLLLTLGLTLTGVITATTRAFREPFVDSETQTLLDRQAQNPNDPSLETLPLLLERDRQVNAWIDEYEAMSDEEKKAKSDAAQKSYEQHMEEAKEYEEWLKNNPPKPSPILPSEVRGIHLAEMLNDSIDIDLYKAVNYWSAGRTAEEYYSAIFSAGFKFENPMQGLVEYHADANRNFKYYPSPTATGPLKVIAEKDGVLTLISVAGNYPKRDEAGEKLQEMVTTPGGSTYYFDTKTFQFVER